MSSNVTLNGVQYVVPAFNDTGWAQGAGNLSLYLAAIASNTLQPTGGAFTLTSELDFGANFGVKQLYLKTETANPASAGVVRLASADTIKWRNNANGADIALSKDASDNLQYNATKVLLSGAVVDADINAAAAIAYSKLALTGSIVNADVNASAAIAYTKLALSASIVNADIASAAAIAVSKLAALTVSRAMVTDASGFASASAVTATELGYVSGVTSAIQTQLNATVANPLTANLAFGSHKGTGIANATAATDVPAYSQVNVLQTVQATYATATANSTTAYADTGISITIAPKLSTSHILIEVAIPFRIVADATGVTGIDLIITDSSNATINQYIGVCGSNGAGASNSWLYTVPIKAWDAPGSTSAKTYKVRLRKNSTMGAGGSVETCYAGFGQQTAFFTATEYNQ